jgi:hypothetical protein
MNVVIHPVHFDASAQLVDFINKKLSKLETFFDCGSSSVGRATAFQAVGRGFEPRLPLKFEHWNLIFS